MDYERGYILFGYSSESQSTLRAGCDNPEFDGRSRSSCAYTLDEFSVFLLVCHVSDFDLLSMLIKLKAESISKLLSLFP